MAYQVADKPARMAALKPLTDEQYKALHMVFMKQRRRARRKVALIRKTCRESVFLRGGPPCSTTGIR